MHFIANYIMFIAYNNDRYLYLQITTQKQVQIPIDNV